MLSCEGHEGSVEAVAFAHSLSLTLSAGMDGKLYIWENASLEARGACEHPEVGTVGMLCGDAA
jgi:WD40 repeat protein